MSVSPHHPIITRRSLIAFVVIDVVLFLLANVTAKNTSHPGTVSDVFWVTFLIGAALLVLLVLFALVRRGLAAR